MKNIALITNAAPKTGAGKYAHNLFKELKKLKKDTILINNTKIKINEDGIINLPPISPILSQTINTIFPTTFKSDNLIVHYTNQGMKPTTKNNILTVLDIIHFRRDHYNSVLNKIVKSNTKIAVRNAIGFICISKQTKNDFCKLFKVPKKKVHITYLGYNKDIFKPHNKKESRKKLNLPNTNIVLHVGTDEPRKNIGTILAALKNQKATFLKIGPLNEDYKRFAKDNKINLIQRTNINEKELGQYYSSADILVFPSTYEGFGLPVLEAMACGCPVITTKISSMPEIGNDAVLYLNEATNEKELKQLINKLLNNKNLQKRLSKKGIKQAKKFSWEKCAKETLQVYKRYQK